MSSCLAGSGVNGSSITLKVLGRHRVILYNLYRSEGHPKPTEEVLVGDLDEIPTVLASGALSRVTSLIISRGALEGTWPERVNSSVCQVLAEARNLREIIWIGIPLAAGTLDTLRRCCRRIKSIHVEFPGNMEEMVLGLSIADDELEDDEPDEDIESLHVYNIFDDLRRFREDLVNVLREAPNLRSLGLSLATETVARCYNAGQAGQYEGWFDRFCGEYTGSGAPRLRLESLICGTAIYHMNSGALANVTDIASLEQVHVENRDVSREGKYISIYDSNEHSGIAFKSVLSKESRKLRRFSAFQFREDIMEARGGIDDPNITRQLALSFANQEYPHFPLQLRMVDLDLQRQDWEEFTAESIIDSLVAGKQDALKGLMVHLPEEPATDEGFAHLDIIGYALRSLANLGQLFIGMDKFGRGRSELTEAQLQHSAKMLATAVPQIRFIGIYWMFWKYGNVY
ncbi:hypothetical protein F5Y14DRAFT_444232 [Nemania sp. NC0429]|nr:hypothetical protein F5Y14DRAFT_444232 [Nemania sp. NC0429]